MNSFAIKKLINPHPGKVNIQVRTISRTTEKLIAESLLAAPTPMIALVLVWVVETGIPKTDEMRRHTEAEISALNP